MIKANELRQITVDKEIEYKSQALLAVKNDLPKIEEYIISAARSGNYHTTLRLTDSQLDSFYYREALTEILRSHDYYVKFDEYDDGEYYCLVSWDGNPI